MVKSRKYRISGERPDKNTEETLRTLLIEAFKGDPVTLLFFGRGAQYEVMAKKHFSETLDLCAAESQLLYTDPPVGVLCGARHFHGSYSSNVKGLGEFSDNLSRWRLNNIYRYNACRYLQYVAVDPSFHRNGIGSALVRRYVASVGACYGRVYLEASSAPARDFFIGIGFDLVGTLDLPGNIINYALISR